MTRAYTDMDETAQGIEASLNRILAALDPEDGSQLDSDIYTVKSFCDVAIRVMRKTNPSKIRSEARTVEIKARMDGVPVVRGAA